LFHALLLSFIQGFINQHLAATQAASKTSMSQVVDAIAEMVQCARAAYANTKRITDRHSPTDRINT
jgi:hypothetical protein